MIVRWKAFIFGDASQPSLKISGLICVNWQMLTSFNVMISTHRKMYLLLLYKQWSLYVDFGVRRFLIYLYFLRANSEHLIVSFSWVNKTRNALFDNKERSWITLYILCIHTTNASSLYNYSSYHDAIYPPLKYCSNKASYLMQQTNTNPNE